LVLLGLRVQGLLVPPERLPSVLQVLPELPVRPVLRVQKQRVQRLLVPPALQALP
jgi:hypothetical protein